MKILAIETSCDDTCAAVLENDRVLSSVISSQIDLHKKWGGVVPEIAKRAHEERIGPVIAEALTRSSLRPRSGGGSNPIEIATVNPSLAMTFPFLNPNQNPSGPAVAGPPSPLRGSVDLDRAGKREMEEMMTAIEVIAVTKGPGLAVALGVGIETAKDLAKKYQKKIIAVNHIEGHLMSNWIKNKKGNPVRNIKFPALNLSASGGHTKIILMDKSTPSPSFDKEGNSINLKYNIVGETLDDAAGEALDKAAKLLGMGYPGGPVIERLAEKGDKNWLKLPRPLKGQNYFDYSFSGLKTSFYYQIRDWPKEKINKNLFNLAASFQEAVLDTLVMKFRKAAEYYKSSTLLASGGVMANMALRKKLRKMAKELGLPIFMPVKKEWNTDNATMIGVAGYYKAMRGEFVEDIEKLDREPRWELEK